jgi:hypothetical protein
MSDAMSDATSSNHVSEEALDRITAKLREVEAERDRRSLDAKAASWAEVDQLLRTRFAAMQEDLARELVKIFLNPTLETQAQPAPFRITQEGAYRNALGKREVLMETHLHLYPWVSMSGRAYTDSGQEQLGQRGAYDIVGPWVEEEGAHE